MSSGCPAPLKEEMVVGQTTDDSPGSSEVIRPTLSLKRNLAWSLAGNAIYVGWEWGMLMALAKLGTPAMVGQFALGLAIAAPLIMFANLHLRHLQGTDARGRFSFAHYWTLRLFTSGAALLVMMGIAVAGGFSRETALVIMAVGLAKCVAQLEDIIYGLLQQHEQMDRLGRSLLLRGPLEFAALTLGVWATGGVLTGVLGLALVRLIVLFSYDLISVRRLLPPASYAGPSPRRSPLAPVNPPGPGGALRSLVWLALPLALVDTLSSLNVNIPRYLVGHFLGEEELGIFVAMAYVVVGGNMVIVALSLAISPRLAKYYAAGDLASFRRLLFRGAGLVAAGGVAGLLLLFLAGEAFLTWCYRPEYARHTSVFRWLLAGGVAVYLATFLRHAMTAARWLRVQLASYAGHDAALLLAGLLLVPRYGMAGAAWSTCLASWITLTVHGVVIAFILRGARQLVAMQGRLRAEAISGALDTRGRPAGLGS
jgi:O-antigen/teichoic acid export membrane protein